MGLFLFYLHELDFYGVICYPCCSVIIELYQFGHTFQTEKGEASMRNAVFALTALVSLVVLVGCDGEPQHLQMINAGNSEYLYVKPDRNVKGDGIRVGYSLRSTKDGRVVHTFQYAPKEVRLEDFDGDGVKDLIYIVPDRNVRGDGVRIGYSMRVAPGKGDGNFQQAKVVSTFDSIK